MNFKPVRPYDPNIDPPRDGPLDSPEYLADLNAPPTTPLPPAEFNRIADELQAVVDAAQSKMKICAEPEFGLLCEALTSAKNALQEHYKHRTMDILFAQSELADTYALRALKAKAEGEQANNTRLKREARAKAKLVDIPRR